MLSYILYRLLCVYVWQVTQERTPRLSARLQQRTNGYQPNKKNGYHGIVTQQFIEGDYVSDNLVCPQQ